MPSMCLTYLESDRGMSKTLQLLLDYTKIPYVDAPLTEEQYAERRPELPFGELPTLVVDDEEYAEAKAILRYIGRLCHMYPSKSPQDAMAVDEWVELHGRFTTGLDSVLHPEGLGIPQLSETQMQSRRLWLREVHFKTFFEYLDTELQSSKWLGGMADATIADFCWMTTLCTLPKSCSTACPDVENLMRTYTFLSSYVKIKISNDSDLEASDSEESDAPAPLFEEEDLVAHDKND